MRVRIVTAVDGWPVGAVVDVLDAARAQVWIAAGSAELVEDDLETALADAPETAMHAPARPRRRKPAR